MTIGNDRTGLALCYLGGLLSACATYSLARRFLSLNYSLLTVALFVVVPMTFWQLGGAGTPDMWTTFFTVMSVTFFANWLGRKDQGSLMLCGLSRRVTIRLRSAPRSDNLRQGGY